MGLLDDVLKAATGAPPAVEGSQSSLASAAISMLSGQSGGISGLVQQFASKGLGNVVSSWVGTGQNLPISPELLHSVLGSEQVQAIAAKAGISPEAASSGLAQILPQMVDHLTPNGEVPQGDLMSQGMELLKGKLFS
ncbi:MAG TPA: YidB family protein [Candidatus Saccharimonadales bacterium]|nr:YidB family protein [Candidatus Saccharimonadales bacterium]